MATCYSDAQQSQYCLAIDARGARTHCACWYGNRQLLHNQWVDFLVRRSPSTKSQFVLIHCGIVLGWGFTCKIRRLQMPKIWAQNSGSFLGPLGLQKRPFVTLFLYKKNIKKRKPHQRHIHSISPQAIEGPCHPWSCPGVWRKHFTF